jgi:hypothetical protein
MFILIFWIMLLLSVWIYFEDNGTQFCVIFVIGLTLYWHAVVENFYICVIWNFLINSFCYFLNVFCVYNFILNESKTSWPYPAFMDYSAVETKLSNLRLFYKFKIRIWYYSRTFYFSLWKLSMFLELCNVVIRLLYGYEIKY